MNSLIGHWGATCHCIEYTYVFSCDSWILSEMLDDRPS